MSARPWYKRYPADFIAGTLSLTLEEKGAYSVALDLIYDRHGPIPDDARWIARVCGCSTRRWNQIRQTLINAGKLILENDTLDNNRAKKQRLSEEKEHEKLSENGVKGAEKTNEKRAAAKENNKIEEKGPSETERHTRSQIPDSREEPSGSSQTLARRADFDVFWKAYPHKVGKGAALKAFSAAGKKAGLATMLAGVERYIAAKPPDRQWCNPATWLNQERWEDQYGVTATRTDSQRQPNAWDNLMSGFGAAATRTREDAGIREPVDRPGDAADLPRLPVPARRGPKASAAGEGFGPHSHADGALLDAADAGEPARGGSPRLVGDIVRSTLDRCGAGGLGMAEDEGPPADAGAVSEVSGAIH